MQQASRGVKLVSCIMSAAESSVEIPVPKALCKENQSVAFIQIEVSKEEVVE